MSEEVKRVGRDLAYEGTVIKVYKDHMKFANGNTAEWDFIHHDGAAAVVPVMDDGKILMVTQYRNALERDTLEIPAGKLDAPGEPGIECASRELEEETGYSSEDLEWLITLRTTVAFCDEKIDIYVAKNLIPSHQHLDEDEFLEVYKMPFAQVLKMVTEGEIIDAIKRPLGAKSLDGVKRRTRAGMGRCQSGFCAPKVMEILARELEKSMEEITKSGGNSRIIEGINKDVF